MYKSCADLISISFSSHSEPHKVLALLRAKNLVTFVMEVSRSFTATHVQDDSRGIDGREEDCAKPNAFFLFMRHFFVLSKYVFNKKTAGTCPRPTIVMYSKLSHIL